MSYTFSPIGRVFALLAIMTLVACGSSETDSLSLNPEGNLPHVSAAAPSDESSPPVAERIMTESADRTAAEMTGAATEADADQASSCLDLVSSGAFSAAVPVCLSAASIDPDNAELQAALAEAQAKSPMDAADRAYDLGTAKGTDAAEQATRALPPKP